MSRVDLSAAQYRAATSQEQCFTCEHFTAGANVCSRYGTRVRPDHVSDGYEPAKGGVAAELSELSHASSLMLTEESDDLVWKDVLVEGLWALSPDVAGQPIRKPLTVVSGDAGPGEISMSQLKMNFDDGAIEQVTIPLSHADLPDQNTGYVKALKLHTEPDGEERLYAGLKFTEPDIKERAKRGSIPNVSVGVLFDYMRKRDGKKYAQALAHVALTPKPWLNGLKPFGETALSQDLEVNSLVAMNFEDATAVADSEDATTGDTLWKQESSADWIRSQVQSALFAVSDAAQENDEPVAYSEVRDINVDDQLALIAAGDETYVASYAIEGTAVAISPRSDWIAAKQEWVKASETRGSFDHLPQERRALVEAQAARKARATGTSVHAISKGGDVVGDSTELSLSEVQEQNRQLAEENSQLKEKGRREGVEKRIKEIGELGLSEHPGLLKEIRSVMLSDDGKPALLLSEDGSGKNEQQQTASDIVERIVKAMPTKDGRIMLGEQAFSHTTDSDDGRPPEDASGELSLEDKTIAALKDLGLAAPVGTGS